MPNSVRRSSPLDDTRAHPILGLRPRVFFNAVLDWVYPPRCVGCGRVDARWCDHCRRALDETPLSAIRLNLTGLQGCLATGEYTGALRTAILALKFNGEPDAAVYLGERMARLLSRANGSFDTLIPVPLFLRRQHERGYNQSELLGAIMAQHTNTPQNTLALARVRATRPQVGLNQAARLRNLQDAFRADPAAVNGQRVLLIDDVCTTGATLRACAEALTAAGASAVYAITAAAALPTRQIPTRM